MSVSGSGEPVLTCEELNAFFPTAFEDAEDLFIVEALGPMTARMRMRIDSAHLRPGDTVSGPTMFAAADVAFYAALLGMIGMKPLAVTSNLNITFMRRPAPTDIIAEARILKLGRRLASGDVLLYSDGRNEPVAMAQTSYALPAE